MKKSKLLLVALCALPLAACSGGQSKNVMDSVSAGSKLTKEIIKQNLSHETHLVSAKDIAVPEGNVTTVNQANGFLFITKDGTVSLFNILSGTTVATNLVSAGISSSYNESELFGNYIRVEQKGDTAETNKYLIFSQNGVLVYSGLTENFVSMRVKSDEIRKVDIISLTGDNTMFEFDGTNVKPVSELPATTLVFGSMKEYGYEEYSCAHDRYSNQIKVKKGDTISTYKLPYNNSTRFEVVDKYLVYVTKYEMSDDSADYQYEIDGVKYKQVIGLFDYTDGSFNESVLNYYIESTHVLKDEKGFKTMSYAKVEMINPDRTLNKNTASWYVMGNDLKLYDDVTVFVDESPDSIFESTMIIEDGEKTFYQVEKRDHKNVVILDDKFVLVDKFNGVNTGVAGVIKTANKANHLGFTNYKGETVVPQKYAEIHESLIGKTVAVDDKGKGFYVTYGLSSSNYAETEIADYSAFKELHDGYLIQTYNEDSHKANGILNNNKSETLYSVEDVIAGEIGRPFYFEVASKKYELAKYTKSDGKVKYGLIEYDTFKA